MDLRPHRRLVVPFSPPLFGNAVAVSDFLMEGFEHFGVACFDVSALPLSLSSLKKMCRSLGVRMMVDCRSTKSLSLSLEALSVSDFLILPSDDAPLVSATCVVLGLCSGQSVLGHDWGGAACDASDVRTLRSSLGDRRICALSGDPASAVRDGADLVFLGEDVVRSKDFAKDARALAESFRQDT